MSNNRNQVTFFTVCILSSFLLGWLLLWMLASDVYVRLRNFLYVLIMVAGYLIVLYSAVRNKFINSIKWFLLFLAFFNCAEFSLRTLFLGGGPAGPFILSPTIVLLFAVFFIWFLRTLVSPKNINHFSVNWYILVFCLILLVSSFYSTNVITSLQSFSIHAMVFPVFFILVTQNVSTRKEIKEILLFLVLYGFIRLFLFYLPIWFSESIEEKFFLYNYNEFSSRVVEHLSVIGVISMFILPLGLYFFSWTRGGKRFAVSVMTGFAIFCLIILGTRAEVIALLLSYFCVNLLFVNRKKCLKSIGGLVCSFVLAGLILHLPRFRFFSLDSGAFFNEQKMRIEAWRSSLRMMMDHPFAGIGLGMWDQYYYLYGRAFKNAETDSIVYLASPHHSFLYYGTSCGIFALSALIFLYAFIFKSGFTAYRRFSNESVKGMVRSIFWALLSFMIYGLIGGNYSTFAFIYGTKDNITLTSPAIYNGLFFGMLTGLLFSLIRIGENDIEKYALSDRN